MNNLNEVENKILVAAMSRMGTATDTESTDYALGTLSKLIPFDSYGIAKFLVVKGILVNIEGMAWFENIPGFEELYITKKLYTIDPVVQEMLHQVSRDKISCQFWKETYEKRPNQEFV